MDVTMMLDVRDLSAGYASDADVLSAVDLDVAAGEIVVLLGASGSGKSTLLRCIAGLHPLRSGRVAIGGRDVAGVPVERRGVGLVFQDHALFPHRDVAGNVAFGPRMQGLDAGAIAERVHDALTLVGLSALAGRSVDQLSGGEQQRVALARALAAGPRLLLLDEPYGSLDRPLRERLLAELPGLVHDSGAGALLVTHDQQEALAVADRVAVLVEGRLRQLATPEVLWTRPVDPDVARFLDVGPTVALPGGAGHAVIPRSLARLPEDGERPGDIVLTASVTAVRFAGDHHRLHLALHDGSALVLRRPGVVGPHRPGATVDVHVAPSDVVAVPHRPGSEDRAQ